MLSKSIQHISRLLDESHSSLHISLSNFFFFTRDNITSKSQIQITGFPEALSQITTTFLHIEMYCITLCLHDIQIKYEP